ncbi:MAG: winged helix-turn-helix domain-containing protein [Candidatus Peribacteraceae bacterium]|nr:winged helix-turn-helix domain-containing protein [Candidatus Peribacteraceae bacterium]
MAHDALKALFSSQTRVKLLSVFLLHPQEEYFIRQLTRLLNEQINSIRRELENLRRIGLVRARHRNRKKYYKADMGFIFFSELQAMFGKEVKGGESATVAAIKTLPGLSFLELAGSFVGTHSKVDLLVVGEVKKDVIELLLAQDPSMRNVKYSLFSKADFLYRLSLRDRFILEIVDDPRHMVVFNAIEKEVEEARK